MISDHIGPKAYKKNPWDRGHLTRRTAITWGDSKFIAKRASNDSCSYANAAMQHENFNQDEWRVPERIVQHFKKDKNGKISVFTGPVFTQTDRWYTRRILGEKVRIPSGFWKVIAYVDKDTESLACQAYVLYQDAQALIDKRGQKDIEIRNHQVTITEIEQLTGIEFDQSLFESNPLHFYPRDWDDKDDGPEGFLAPISTNKEDLDTGIVFSREMAESKEFESRKRKIPMEAFENLIHQIKEI